jgi:hypothetical protein
VNTTLLIVHGLLAVALLGGITHQAAAACWPANALAKSRGSFLASFRGVAGARYTIANIVLYCVTATWARSFTNLPAGGAALSGKRPALDHQRHLRDQGAVRRSGSGCCRSTGWRTPLDARLAPARGDYSAALLTIVCYSFLVGHVLNNVRAVRTMSYTRVFRFSRRHSRWSTWSPSKPTGRW